MSEADLLDRPSARVRDARALLNTTQGTLYEQAIEPLSAEIRNYARFMHYRLKPASRNVIELLLSEEDGLAEEIRQDVREQYAHYRLLKLQTKDGIQYIPPY